MLTTQEKQNLLDYFSKRNHKHVCANCSNYSLLLKVGYCTCREQVDMIRLANRCPDWRGLK